MFELIGSKGLCSFVEIAFASADTNKLDQRNIPVKKTKEKTVNHCSTKFNTGFMVSSISLQLIEALSSTEIFLKVVQIATFKNISKF